jgi:hypothetical protein
VLAGERSVVGLDGSVGRNLIEIENFFDWLTATEIHLLGYHGAVSLCKLGSCLGSCTLTSRNTSDGQVYGPVTSIM